MGAVVRGRPELAAAVAELKEATAAAEPLVERLDGEDAARRLVSTLSPLSPKLARLASLAHAECGDLATRDLEQFSRLHWVLWCLLMGTAASGLTLALAGVLIWHNRLL